MPIPFDIDRLLAAYRQVRDELLAERTPDGHWVGELSSSALATATAISALATANRRIGVPPVPESADLITRGVAWLIKQQNPDGGFGDTDLSHSNIATTYLVVAALHLAQSAIGNAQSAVGNALRGVPGCDDASLQSLLARANAYIESKGRLPGLRDRYGIDKTFVVPIMTNLALAGLVEWREIDPLPFELACVPQSWYRFVGMPVVSYAIPALVAIGQARFHHAPPRNPLTRLIRQLSISRSLKVLRRMQPDSGGYLEATPLTSFVVMSLASVCSRHAPRDEPGAASGDGYSGHITRSVMATQADEIIAHGVQFLINSARPDGSWPIDTNLATWNTTLSINALAGAGENVAELLGPKCLEWLLSCQHTKRHAFTGANPGGFGWSDLSGAVPDADDTPGAMLALSSLAPFRDGIDNTAQADPVRTKAGLALLEALWWLGRLRNRDGGWPTFCRGWGTLPFDRSGVDLTAHALRAIAIPLRTGPTEIRSLNVRKYGVFKKGLSFIERNQHADGSWSPLWFGNQDHPSEENLVYGTAKVLMAYRDLGLMDSPEAQRGVAWLIANQNDDGGWGSGVWEMQNAECRMQNAGGCDPQSKIQNLKSSIEETALAVEALLAVCPPSPEPRAPSPELAAVEKGLGWLMNRVESGQHRQPAPIGFYFAKLWYYERLYPLIFTVAALGRACRQFAPPADNKPAAATSDSRAS
ncbi:MAG TPA: prenyltransferase/squalene oxidase repeat-containing protein [Pirellulaceae bacterium]